MGALVGATQRFGHCRDAYACHGENADRKQVRVALHEE
jgi:hypothetical protein